MRRTARLLLRSLAFPLFRLFAFLDRQCRSVAFATFTPQELNALNVAEWEAFGEAGRFDSAGSFSWEENLYRESLRPGESVLVIGAGTGRDVIPLLAAGHPVTALDITPRALAVLAARAEARGFKVPTLHASIVDADLPGQAFDVIIFSWLSFSYLHGENARRLALRRCAPALRQGGRILLSYQCDEGVVPPPTRAGKVVARLVGGFEAETGDHFNVTGRARLPSVFFLHAFKPQDIDAEVRAAGLGILAHVQPGGGLGVMTLTPGAP